MKSITQRLAIAVFSVSLLAVAGCASTSTKEGTGEYVDDAVITTKVKASFVDTKDLYGSAFKVVTENGVVFLMGRVTQREGNLAGDVSRGVSGVRKVVKIFDYIGEPELKNMLTSPDKQDVAK